MVIAIVVAMVLQGRARDSVEQLFSARPVELEMALEKAEGLSWWTKEMAREEFSTSDDPDERWRSALLLAQEGPDYQKSIAEALLKAHPEEVQAMLSRLSPYSKETTEFFMREAFVEEHPERGIRAACALADLGLGEEQWSRASESILDWLGSIEKGKDFAPMLVPVAHCFEKELRKEVREGGESYALLLGLLHQDDLEDLLDAFFECKPSEVPVFREFIIKHSEGLARCLEIAEDVEEEHSKRARAMAVLLLSGEFPKSINLDDLNFNAQAIYRFASVEAGDLIRYLDESRDDAVWQRVLLLILSTKEKEMILPADFSELKARVDQLYSFHPDAGVHSSAELVLRRWEEELPNEEPGDDADWFFSPDTGMTFVIFEPPKPLGYGAKRFAMATSELSEMVLKLRNNDVFPNGASPYRSAPAGDIRSLMDLCEFLSKKEGLESCYEFVGMDKGYVPQKEWMPRKDYLDRNGYRIPTEEEWLWACVQDHRYPGVYGENSPEVVPLFAWCPLNSQDGFQPGRDLYPSVRGMFDMVGNFEEVLWREVPYQDWKSDIAGIREAQRNHVFVRGGNFSIPVGDLDVRSDSQNGQINFQGLLVNATLRLVRTYPHEE